MTKELLAITILIGACSASCNQVQPMDENLQCDQIRTELELEQDDNTFCESELEVCYSDKNRLEMGDGEHVDLVAPVDAVDTSVAQYAEQSDDKKMIASLIAGNERQAKKHAEDMAAKDAKYDGLLEEFRVMQENYGALSSECNEMRELCDLHASGVWQSVEGE